MAKCALIGQRYWPNKAECDDAERRYYMALYGKVDVLAAIANGGAHPDLAKRIGLLESENKILKKASEDLQQVVKQLEDRVSILEKGADRAGGDGAESKAARKSESVDDAEEFDIFGNDSGSDDDAEKAKVREERLRAYHEKKAKKPALVAKTSVLLDIKPWDDETDMDAVLKAAKSIEKDGLVWGASKLVPVGYGIKKLQLLGVVEDEKVSIDELSEEIAEFEDLVQSVDVVSMSKI